jgi:hypothetical protein
MLPLMGETSAAPKGTPRVCVGPSAFGLLAAVAGFAAVVAWQLWREGHPPAIVAHGALMATAWAAMLPAGAAIARWRKVTRAQRFPDQLDNQFWWNRHRQLQYGGIVLTLLGLGAILVHTGGRFAGLHGQLGLLLVLASLLQLALSGLRGSKGGPTDPRADPARPETWRGDHFDMTPKRIAFERAHKALGWGSLAAGALAIALGAALIGVPDALSVTLALPYLAFAFFAARQAQAGRRVDTYVAIWGRLRSPLLPSGLVPPAGPSLGRGEPGQP